MFEWLPFLKQSQEIKTVRDISRARRKEIFIELTQYQFLLTHFIKSNIENKNFLNNFWAVLERLAENSGFTEKFHTIKKGILTQVATYKIFEYLNKHPQLSHPEQDAFESIDLLTESGDAIQIKSTGVEKPQFIEIKNQVAVGGVEIKTPQTNNLANISSRYHYQAQLAGEKMEDYLRRMNEKGHKEVKAFMLVIPIGMVDGTTGKPSTELINFVKDNLAKIESTKFKEPLPNENILAKAA